MPTHGDRPYVITWRPGENWREGLPVTEQPLDAHRQYFGELHARGRLAVAGPFLDEMAGGMAILNVATREEAEAIMAADPAVLTKVFIGTVRPFFVVFGENGAG